jgi:hypothetical protein
MFSASVLDFGMSERLPVAPAAKYLFDFNALFMVAS